MLKVGRKRNRKERKRKSTHVAKETKHKIRSISECQDQSRDPPS